MLVLSRRQDQTVCFPKLGIEVQVIRAGGKVVRLGVTAPPEVLVLRGELATATDSHGEPSRGVVAADHDSLRNFRHDIRDRLNVVCLSLQVLRSRVQNGQIGDLERLIERALKSLGELDAELDSVPVSSVDSESPHNEASRVLIVEDSMNEGQLLAEYLDSHGFETALVGNGREAIHHLRRHGKPDVLLIDMNMPTMDGRTTIRVIREQAEFDGLRMFGVSGMTREEAGIPIGPDGVDCWYTKPIKAQQLVRDIQAFLVPAH